MLALRRLLDRFRRRPRSHLDTGRDAEHRAARHLEAHGYRILARNLRLRGGEVDIVALDPAGTLVIVEVKAGVANPASLPPEVHVDRRKQEQLTRLAPRVARKLRMTRRRIRFDVVAVEYIPGREPLLRHHVDAFRSRV